MKNISKTDKIAWIILVIYIAMQLSIMKVLAPVIPAFNVSYNTPFLSCLYLLMLIAVCALVIVPRVVTANGYDFGILKKYRVLLGLLALLLLSIVVTDVVTIVKGQLRITNILTHNLDYFYAFMALPILILLYEDVIKYEKFSDTIIILTLVSMAIRSFVVFYYSRTGIELMCITRESTGEFWFRNDRIRVMAPSLLLLCVPVTSYMFLTVSNKLKKAFYAVSLVAILLFTSYIWQARAGLITMAGGIAVISLFRQMSKKVKIISWGIVVAGILGFIAVGGIGKIIAMFSIDDTAAFAGENKGHLFAYQLFGERFLKSPILGEGLTETLAQWFPNGRALWMCDAGFFYSLLPMGILIGVFLIALFVRGLLLYFKRRGSNEGGLILSIVCMFTVYEFIADIFFTPLAFTVPIMLAIVEYQGLKDQTGDKL